MVCYDYHKFIKSGAGSVESTLTQTLLPLITHFTTSHGFYVSEDGRPMRLQTGTIRSNCLDCLDRTNSVQNFVGQQVRCVCVCVCGVWCVVCGVWCVCVYVWCVCGVWCGVWCVGVCVCVCVCVVCGVSGVCVCVCVYVYVWCVWGRVVD